MKNYQHKTVQQKGPCKTRLQIFSKEAFKSYTFCASSLDGKDEHSEERKNIFFS